MWPHSLVIGVHGSAVTIGTDDPGLVGFLEPWRIDEPTSIVDFGLETAPAQPTERSAPRILPSLKHGSEPIARVEDTAFLRDALLRIVVAATSPVPDGLLRVNGTVLERGGVGHLVPEPNLRTVSHRALGRRGITAHVGQTVLVDVATLEVVLDVPLGIDTPGRRLALASWWMNHREPAIPTTPAEDVARLLGNVVVDAELVADQALLCLLASRLVTSMRPRYVAFGRQALENELTALFGR